MNNKFYDDLIRYIKENYLFLIIIITIMVVFNINTNYSIYKPGGSINVTDRISSDAEVYPSEGSFNMAYVGMIEGKLPFYLLAKIIPSWDVVKNNDITYSDEETIEEMLKRDRIYYEESISNALYLAYDRSGIQFTIKKELNYIVYVDKNCTADLQIGDEILKYDDILYSDFATLKNYVRTKSVGEQVKFLIKRGGKEISTIATIFLEKDQAFIGLSSVSIYEFDSTVNIKIDSKASESGPSGGLMLTLAIYNALTKEDITKGHKIVGTGTIEVDGSVGEIGGVKYKLAGAVKDKADIFIVPKGNYDDAVKYAKEQKYDILIKGVSTFDEALQVLKDLK